MSNFDQTHVKIVSDKIYNLAELSFCEDKSSIVLMQALKRLGFSIDVSSDIKNAFVARPKGLVSDSSLLTIGICAEYDALPEVGHACGHNLISAAALEFARLYSQSEVKNFELIIYGTPGEEGFGGKVHMLNAGLFDAADILMMTHGGPYNLVTMPSSAISHLKIETYGISSHAAMTPWKQDNALEKLLKILSVIEELREDFVDGDVASYYIKNGGSAANVIADYASAHLSIRGQNSARRDFLVDSFIKNANLKYVEFKDEGAQVIKGLEELSNKYLGIATVSDPPYDNILRISSFEDAWTTIATNNGIILEDIKRFPGKPSTDMGNVSHFRPSLHTMFIVKDSVPLHTTQFQIAAGTQAAFDSAMKAAKTMFDLAKHLATNDELLRNIQQEFNQLKQ